MTYKQKTTRLIRAKQTGASRYKNPTWRVWLEDGSTHLTEIDGQVGYYVTNYLPEDGSEGPEVVVVLSGGRIIDIIDKSEEEKAHVF